MNEEMLQQSLRNAIWYFNYARRALAMNCEKGDHLIASMYRVEYHKAAKRVKSATNCLMQLDWWPDDLSANEAFSAGVALMVAGIGDLGALDEARANPKRFLEAFDMLAEDHGRPETAGVERKGYACYLGVEG